ncbi:MAG: cytochrome c3 family protein [Nitrospirota bacterium]
MIFRSSFILIVAVTVLTLFLPVSSIASPTAPPDESRLCLGCHGNRDFTAELKSGEKLSLFVNAETLKTSVHNMLACSGCHTGFSAEKHPSRILKNRREYSVSGSALCRNCHTKFKTPLHAKMADMAKKGGKVCVDCHGSHSVEPVSKAVSRDSAYCLGCHRNELTMAFRDGESQSARVDPDVLRVSVHNKLYCSDCHFGFSPEEHPERKFKSKRDYTIAASESCRRCHFDKYTKTLESIHYVMLSQGNLNAPVCVDCHGAHSVAQTGKERTLSAKRCEKCHSDIYNTYAASVHGSALFNEHNQDVPVCADCHMAHNIEDPRTFDYRENIPQMCGNCHANKELMDKYGLTTAVLNSYLQDFHGVTLKLYKKQKDIGDKTTLKPIAVCVDCHGIHDITLTTGPNSSIVKTNLVKRCRKCHPGASENFPDSWISHYKPSLKKAPLVFAINLIYKIFIPFMMVGLILQILLHIWRYAVNR